MLQLPTLSPIRAARLLLQARASVYDRALAFSPDQPRDEFGRWTDTGASSIVPSGIVAAVQQADGGFTYSPMTGKSPTTGYALSLHPEREHIIDAKDAGVVELATYAAQNWDLLKEKGNYFGAWHNPQDDKVYLDISTVVDTSEEADRLGREANQLAYFDLSQGKSIEIASERRIKAASAYNRSRVWASNFGRYYRARASLDGSGADRSGDRESQETSRFIVAGGPGSGNFGHAGRPGQVGGSSSTETVEVPALVAYHGTTNEAWESIQEQGLIPHGGAGADVLAGVPEYVMGGPGSKRRASVYISDDPRYAASFAAFVAGEQGLDPLILEVRIPRTELQNLVADTEFVAGLRFTGRIPPEWIRLRTDLDVDKLKKPLFALRARRRAAAANDDRVFYAVVVVRKKTRALEFNPDQPRDEQGQWTSGGGLSADETKQVAEVWYRSDKSSDAYRDPSTIQGKKMTALLNAQPVYQGKAYRGLTLSDADLKALEEAKGLRIDLHSSASQSPNVAQDFMRVSAINHPTFNKVLLEVDGRAADMKHFNYLSDNQFEYEVVLKAGTTYALDSITREGSFTRVRLKEKR